MQIAYRAKDIAEAHIVAGLLRANGIEPHVGGHYLQGAMGEIGAAGFANVHVDDDDLYEARVLLEAYEANQEPSAGELDAESTPDRYAQKFLIALVVVAVLIVVFL